MVTKNKIQVFSNAEFGQVRTITKSGEIWFVGKDVAEILGYENQNRDIVRHVDEEDRKMLDGKTQYQNGIELGQRGGCMISQHTATSRWSLLGTMIMLLIGLRSFSEVCCETDCN